MDNERFSLAEFRALFPGRFESQEQLLREYRSFLTVFEQLDRAPVPELSNREKAEIFRLSWQDRRPDWSWAWAWLDLFKRPAVTFALGIVLGCALVFAALHGRLVPVPPETVRPPTVVGQSLTVENMRYTQVYRGKLVERLYPDIENPKIVVERAEKSAAPQRVLYGTLDDGEVYVVWNL